MLGRPFSASVIRQAPKLDTGSSGGVSEVMARMLELGDAGGRTGSHAGSFSCGGAGGGSGACGGTEVGAGKAGGDTSAASPSGSLNSQLHTVRLTPSDDSSNLALCVVRGGNDLQQTAHLIDKAAGAVIGITRESGQVFEWNAYVAKATGIGRLDAVGRHLIDVIRLQISRADAGALHTFLRRGSHELQGMLAAVLHAKNGKVRLLLSDYEENVAALQLFASVDAKSSGLVMDDKVVSHLMIEHGMSYDGAFKLQRAFDPGAHGSVGLAAFVIGVLPALATPLVHRPLKEKVAPRQLLRSLSVSFADSELLLEPPLDEIDSLELRPTFDYGSAAESSTQQLYDRPAAVYVTMRGGGRLQVGTLEEVPETIIADFANADREHSQALRKASEAAKDEAQKAEEHEAKESARVGREQEYKQKQAEAEEYRAEQETRARSGVPSQPVDAMREVTQEALDRAMQYYESAAKINEASLAAAKAATEEAQKPVHTARSKLDPMRERLRLRRAATIGSRFVCTAPALSAEALDWVDVPHSSDLLGLRASIQWLGVEGDKPSSQSVLLLPRRWAPSMPGVRLQMLIGSGVEPCCATVTSTPAVPSSAIASTDTDAWSTVEVDNLTPTTRYHVQWIFRPAAEVVAGSLATLSDRLQMVNVATADRKKPDARPRRVHVKCMLHAQLPSSLPAGTALLVVHRQLLADATVVRTLDEYDGRSVWYRLKLSDSSAGELNYTLNPFNHCVSRLASAATFQAACVAHSTHLAQTTSTVEDGITAVRLETAEQVCTLPSTRLDST